MNQYTMLLQYNPRPALIPPFSEAGFLFNTHRHLSQQYQDGFYLVTALNRMTQQADARCAFFVQSDKALSPFAAPFGSIEFTESLPGPILDTFIRTLLQAARLAGATTLRLVNYPACYAPGQVSELTQKLHQQGFDLVDTQQTSFLPVTDSAFAVNLVPAERRRLAKCISADFQFRHWQNPDRAEVVGFLQERRHQKGHLLTITPERLANLLQAFPDQCAVFTIMDGETIAALTVTIRVRNDILYNFQPASDANYHSFSPMVLLISGLYGFCQQQGIKLLDLGLSLDHNRQHKPSLLQFKRNLGCLESPKLIFEKDLTAS